jgi:hypothetical protein
MSRPRQSYSALAETPAGEQIDADGGLEQRLVADGYFEITAALIAGRKVGQVPEFRAWRQRTATLAGKVVAAPIVRKRRGRPRKVTTA